MQAILISKINTHRTKFDQSYLNAIFNYKLVFSNDMILRNSATSFNSIDFSTKYSDDIFIF